jgi:hypothetical protein
MPHAANDSKAAHFADILGKAVVDQWHVLGQDVQRLIFEAAVEKFERAGEGDIREALAVFLHDHHPRTGHDEPRR